MLGARREAKVILHDSKLLLDPLERIIPRHRAKALFQESAATVYLAERRCKISSSCELPYMPGLYAT